jgi:hypothetical protein
MGPLWVPTNSTLLIALAAFASQTARRSAHGRATAQSFARPLAACGLLSDQSMDRYETVSRGSVSSCSLWRSTNVMKASGLTNTRSSSSPTSHHEQLLRHEMLLQCGDTRWERGSTVVGYDDRCYRQ